MVADKLTTLKHGQRGDTSIDVSVTQPQAAELLNVSLPSVQRARKVRAGGDEKLIADVESGKVTVSAAAQHVAAVTNYPELANPRIPQKEAITIAKNLDALPEDERAEARSRLIADDTDTKAILSGRPPVPLPLPRPPLPSAAGIAVAAAEEQE